MVVKVIAGFCRETLLIIVINISSVRLLCAYAFMFAFMLL